MVKCPRCKNYGIKFDFYFKRPRCYDCGWLPSKLCEHTMYKFFDPCNKCWGYSELRDSNDQCNRCKNKGKILNSLGKEIVEVIQDEITQEIIRNKIND